MGQRGGQKPAGATVLAAGSVVGGRYRLERTVKEGAFATTFVARDVRTGARVMLKTTAADRMAAGAVVRLEHEAAVLSQLQARELAPLLELGREGDLVYLVTPLVPGTPLDRRLAHGALPVADALTVACCVLRGLAHLHQHGILHGDVTPANVIVDGDRTIRRAVLVDFGLARSAALDPAVRDRPAGTARYVSPEQAGLLDARPDESADLYSAGILLFECLAGHPPFEAEAVGELLRQHLSSPPPSLRSLGVAVPGALDELVARLLRKDPRDRYQSAAGVLPDLARIADAIDGGVADPAVVIGLHDRRRTLTEPAFVGRVQELAALEGAIAAAADGPGALVLLEGESGGGKTRVLEELGRRCAARELVLLQGQGRDQAAPVPLQVLAGVAEGIAATAGRDPAWAAVLRTRLGPHADAVSHALPELAGVLAVGEGVALGPEAFGESRTLDALSVLLRVLGSPDRPAVVVLDDCQWADELTVKLLDHWWGEGKAPPSHVVVIAAFRSEEVAGPHALRRLRPASHVRLRSFAPADVRLLVESMAGQVPPAVVGTVEQLSAGNPFMASAVLRGLVESGALADTPEGWRFEGQAIADVQSSGEAAQFLTRRLELLPDATLRLVAAGAVLGKDFDVGLAADLAGQTPLDAMAALHEARRRHIVWTQPVDGRCSFVHDKLREALLDRLGAGDRGALHRLAARRIEQADPDRLFELAYHFDAGGQHDRALPYALAAGAQARAQHALEVAEQQYAIALRGLASADPPVRRRTVQELGEVLMLRGRYDEAADRLAQAKALATDDQTRARIEAQLGELAFKRGDVRGGADALERGLHLLGQRVPHGKPALLLWLLWEVLVQALHTAVPRLFVGRRSNEGAETEILAIHIYSRLAYAYWFGHGLLACGWSHLREMNLAERYPPGPALAQAYSEHAPVMTMLPLFGRGIAYAQRSLTIRRGVGDVWGQGQSLHFFGVGLYGASRYRDAMARCREAAEMMERTGDRWEVNTARWHVAYCLYRLGRLPDAVETARAVHRAGVDIGDAQAAGISLSVWAKASAGRVPQDLIEAEMARGSNDVHTAAEVLQARAVCLLHEHRADEAVAALEEAQRLVEKQGLRQEYVAPVLPWLATARRHQLLAVDDTTPGRRLRLLREARVAARRARRLARWYRNNLPHALRETALVAALGGRPSSARRGFDRALAVAEEQSAAWEHAQTLLARGEVGLELGWPGAADDVATATRALRDMGVPPGTKDTDEGAPAAPDEDRVGRITLSLADRFETVLEVGRTIASGLTRDAIFAAVRDAASVLLRGERCIILEIEDDDSTAVTAVSSELDGDLDDLCRELVRVSASTRRVASVGSDTDEGMDAGLLTSSHTRSALCAPVFVRDRIVASLYVSHSQVSALFGQEEKRLAEFIATLAGAALENAEGFAEVQALTRTLEERVAERTAQLASVNRELSHRAFHDPLTDLANRVLFRDRIGHAIALRDRAARPLAVLLVDLDDFKSVNDTWGHAAGDELLVGVGDRLGRCLRPGDTLARLGGDEFGILLEDSQEAAAAARVADRIVAVLGAPFRLQGAEVWIHASIGIAVGDGHGDSAEELLRKADAAMYVAKERGKDRVAAFEPYMLDAVVTRGKMRAALQLAVEEHGGDFVVHYQPILELASGRVASVEALVRWNRPGTDLTGPDEFVPLAEEAGFIVAIGGWVMERACRQVAAWQQAMPGDAPIGLHVNLSARQLQDPRLVGTVADLLTATSLVPESLVLELTESGLMRDPGAAAVQLQSLRELGVRLALDDFGTGYSSLGYLQRFPINVLKIDKCFVDGMGRGQAASSLARAIIQIGHTLDLSVVAEGVERPAQAAGLRALGCHLGQGYLWSPAQPAADLERWLRERARVGLRAPMPASSSGE